MQKIGQYTISGFKIPLYAPQRIVNRGLAGTGIVHAADRCAIRPIWQLAQQGMEWDDIGYPIMALWTACFIQAYEAAFGDEL